MAACRSVSLGRLYRAGGLESAVAGELLESLLPSAHACRAGRGTGAYNSVSKSQDSQPTPRQRDRLAPT